jgi:hypothetical protein
MHYLARPHGPGWLSVLGIVVGVALVPAAIMGTIFAVARFFIR